MKETSLRNTVYIAVFAAFMVTGVFIRIPLGPVPVVLTNLFVLLAGYLLGPRTGTYAVVLYLFLGAVGLPVFSAGGGAALFLGPTGGYLIGYLFGSTVTGFIASANKKRLLLLDILAFTAGAVIIYVPGLFWLKLQTGLSWQNAVKTGILPFLPGDALKIALGVALVKGLCRTLPEFFPVFSKGGNT